MPSPVPGSHWGSNVVRSGAKRPLPREDPREVTGQGLTPPLRACSLSGHNWTGTLLGPLSNAAADLWREELRCAVQWEIHTGV